MTNQSQKLGALVAALCQANMSLWREEDNARSGDDAQVVRAKRAIDKLNQERNDLIEKIDDYFVRLTGKGRR